MLVFGAMLPVDHIVEHDITVPRSQQDVWNLIINHANEPKWRPELKSVTRLPDRNGHKVWQEEEYSQKKLALETVVFEPPRRMVREIIDQTAFGGTWTID